MKYVDEYRDEQTAQRLCEGRPMQAQHALVKIRWGPHSAGGTGKMLEVMRQTATRGC